MLPDLGKHVHVDMPKAEQLGDALEGRVRPESVDEGCIAVCDDAAGGWEPVESEVFSQGLESLLKLALPLLLKENGGDLEALALLGYATNVKKGHAETISLVGCIEKEGIGGLAQQLDVLQGRDKEALKVALRVARVAEEI